MLCPLIFIQKNDYSISIGLDWIALNCITFYGVVLYCIRLYWIGLNCIELDWIVLYWIGLHFNVSYPIVLLLFPSLLRVLIILNAHVLLTYVLTSTLPLPFLPFPSQLGFACYCYIMSQGLLPSSTGPIFVVFAVVQSLVAWRTTAV